MYKKFLKPTMDITFKKIFGDQKRTDILIAFLNAILNRKNGHLITEIIVVDPYNHPEVNKAKLSIVDIKCKDEKNVTYIIELQVIKEPAYKERAQFYTYLEVARQLKEADEYKNLTPVIFIGIAGFNLFKSADYLSDHATLNLKTFERELTLTEFHFIELEKFNKNLDELSSVIDQWVYFLKYASEIDQVPDELRVNKEITKAFKVLEVTGFTQEELYAYDKLIDQYRLEIGRVSEFNEQLAKFNEQNEQMAKTNERLAKFNEQMLEIAKSLLGVWPIEMIAEKTGLSIEDIKKLKKK